MTTVNQKIQMQGCETFRMRIVCALLKGTTIRINNIRDMDENPGLRDFEVSFLRLVDSITHGSRIKINPTGTSLVYKPGMLVGGDEIVHQCPNSRSIGYYIEGLLLIAPFCQNPVSITFTGVTYHSKDISVDILRTVSIPLLKQFGVDGNIILKVDKRGPLPLGGGQVSFECPTVKALRPITLLEEGKIKRIRGLAYTVRCQPQLSTRAIEAARGVFNNLLPDVFIFSQHFKGRQAGGSPGYALSLVAESTTGVMLSAELDAQETVDLQPTREGDASSIAHSPQLLGRQASHLLLEEISKGGCVDANHQAMALLLMAICPEDISRVRLGKLSPYSIKCLRLFRQIFGVTFRIKPQTNGSLILSCRGVGFINYARKTA